MKNGKKVFKGEKCHFDMNGETRRKNAYSKQAFRSPKCHVDMNAETNQGK